MCVVVLYMGEYVSICVQTWGIMYTSRCLFVHLDHYAFVCIYSIPAYCDGALLASRRACVCMRVFVRKCSSKGACVKVRVCVPAAALQPAAAGAGPGAAEGKEPAAGGSAASVAA